MSDDFDIEAGEPIPPEDQQEVFEEKETPVDTAVEQPSEEPAEQGSEPDKTDSEEPRAQRRIRQEIERRKALENDLKSLREQNEAMEKRFAQFMEKMQPQEPQGPSFEDDPAEYLRNQHELTQKQLQELSHQRTQEEESRKQQEEALKFVRSFEAQEAEYANERKDYYDAVNHLRSQRAAFWQSIGHDPASAAQMVAQEMLSIVQTASANGADAPEAIYNLAKQSGYQMKQGNVTQLRENVERSQSLGSNGSTPRAARLSDLAAMSDDEFDAATDGQKWASLWR